MLEAISLTKRFEGTAALQGVNLKVEPGEIFCLLGPNGAGKTTLINVFLNFVEPTDGEARVNGIDVTQQPIETKRYLAYIPEQVMLYGVLSGLENLSYFAALAGRHDLSKEQLLALLTEVGIFENTARRRVSTYSKGMRQKVGIAIAMAKKAKALLLDEPTSGLDPQAANEFSQLLNKAKDGGAAILMATHDLFHAKQTGTRVGIMKQGTLVATLNSEEISHIDLEQLYLKHMRD
jgi:ABC-2 type transport system ATP-binding protein